MVGILEVLKTGRGIIVSIVSGIVGIVLLYFLGRWFFNKSGREGLEKDKERLTKDYYERIRRAEYAEKDERKECRRLQILIMYVYQHLMRTGRGELARDLGRTFRSIHDIINILDREKMNLNRAFETYNVLHNSLNELISKLPTEDIQIRRWIDQINLFQKNLYTDLITEMNMEEDEKKELRRMLAETNLEEGTLSQAA